VATIRSGFEEVMQHVPVAGDIRTTETAVGGVDAVEVTVDGVDSDNVILYFHGGVYVIVGRRWLTVAALLASRDADRSMPSSAFVMSPWADLTCPAGPSSTSATFR
jgi:hypothetical protein